MSSLDAKQCGEQPPCPSELRRCALCLKEISRIQLCGGCRRRAYCSRECQTKDWKVTGPGQHHKYWCALNCCEEDIDWEVVSFPGKGLGVRAKRLIPALSRIIVDAIRSDDDPMLLDLEPHGGNLFTKKALNALGTDIGSVVGARISRVNHSCAPNASHTTDVTMRSLILFANRDIQAGEEITISYTPYGSDAWEDFAQAREILRGKWGIDCPADCRCRDAHFQALVRESNRLDKQIISKGSMGNTFGALEDVQRLLQLHEEMHASPWLVMRANYDGFQMAIASRKSLPKAKRFIQEAYRTTSAVLHPDSEKNKTNREYLRNHQTHRNYLILG